MKEIQFDGQREGEQIIYLFRPHYFTLFYKIFFVLVSGAVFIFIANLSKLLLQIGLFVFILILIWFIIQNILWYYSYYILTNQRLRCIQRNSVFNQVVMDISLESINNVLYQERGLWSILKCGDILINSESGDLIISNIKNAETKFNKIQNILEK